VAAWKPALADAWAGFVVLYTNTMIDRKLSIKKRSIELLIPYCRNARTHSDEQIEQIARSLDEFGWTNPVLVDGDNGIIAGHGRVLAARKLGMTEIPCIELDGLSDDQKRAYIIADNKLAENAGWDRNMLELELSALSDNGFDLGTIGFTDDEVSGLFGDADELMIKEVHTSKVEDRFWISIRGPLEHQAQALQRLQKIMADIPVDVELGTVADDGLGAQS